MDSPLKERLTGALIVVALLIIVVPEMLSGPDKSSADAGSASDAGPPVRTYSLELGSAAAARTQDQSALTPQSSEPAAAVPEAPPPVASTPLPPADVKPEVTPVADAPAADAPAADVPATGKAGLWWTQLGSFAARDNADRLARDLRARGYTVNVALIKVGGRDLYRVRSGPVASREAAVALQARLAEAGHKSSLVAP